MVEGCTNPQEAGRRARALVEATAPQVETDGGNRDSGGVLRERAQVLLTGYLVAAAGSGATIATIRAWAGAPPTPEPPDTTTGPVPRGGPVP